jgi:hypothetical protein
LSATVSISSRARLGGLLEHVGRDLLDRVVLADLGLAAPHEAFISTRSTTPMEVGLGADRQLDDGGGRAEALDGSS